MKHASAHEKPPPLREGLPDLPEEVEALVETLMAKKPEDRFQTGEQLAAAIDVIKSGPASIGTARHPRVRSAGRRWGLLLAGASVLVGALGVALLLGFSRPGKAEKAYRDASLAATDIEKIARYRNVAALYPGTSWASDAQAQALGLRRSLLDRELLGVKAAAFDGKLPFSEVMTRIDRLRSSYPEGASKISSLEGELGRARVIARTKEFAEALRSRRSDEKPERFKELIAPELWKKSGEGWVMPAVRTAMGIAGVPGVRIEEVDVTSDQITLEGRKTAAVPLKAATFSGKTKERSTHRLSIHWLWQEGDWYLTQTAIREDK
jgi:hypothetical protein